MSTTIARTRDQAALRFRRGRAAGGTAPGTPLLGRRLQEDSLLDTAGGSSCAHSGRAAHRKRRTARAGSPSRAPCSPRSMKVREEARTVVGDGEVLLRMFERTWSAGVVPLREVPPKSSRTTTSLSRSTKRRSGSMSRSRAAKRHRRRGSRARPHDQADYIVDSYRGLFLQAPRRARATGADMMFDACA